MPVLLYRVRSANLCALYSLQCICVVHQYSFVAEGTPLSSSRGSNSAGMRRTCILARGRAWPTHAQQCGALQSKLDAIEKQRRDLAAELAKLDIERIKHVRQIKLQSDYVHSEYNINNATAPLKGQYVLMSMFGKGGFAAVWRLLPGLAPAYLWQQYLRDWC